MAQGATGWCFLVLQFLPVVSIVVPFFGLANSILRILKGNPKKELQWRHMENIGKMPGMTLRYRAPAAMSLSRCLRSCRE